MRIIGIETSSARGSVALTVGSEVVAVRAGMTAKAHGEHLLKWVDEALAEAGWTRASVDRIAVGVGPGSFTGLRIGIAFAAGLSIGLGVPLFGLNSLRLLAAAAPAGIAGVRCPVLDAGRGECFWALYTESGEEQAPPQVGPTRDLLTRATRLATGPLFFLGPGASGLPGSAGEAAPDTFPSAEWAARVALALPPSAAEADPLYLRPADAIRPDLPPSPLLSEPAS